MNDIYAKQRAQEEEDRAREFESVRLDACNEREHWSQNTADAAIYFECCAKFLFGQIARNYYDEAEIGRLAKEMFGDAVDTFIERYE